jgi:hypothetical protein
MACDTSHVTPHTSHLTGQQYYDNYTSTHSFSNLSRSWAKRRTRAAMHHPTPIPARETMKEYLCGNQGAIVVSMSDSINTTATTFAIIIIITIIICLRQLQLRVRMCVIIVHHRI